MFALPRYGIREGAARVPAAASDNMYSLSVHDLQAKARKAEAAVLRRHQSSQRPSAQRRDFVLSTIYGKTLNELSESAAARREAAVEAARAHPELSTMLGEPEEPPGMVFHHSFRDREEGLEVGGSTISGLRYVPRAYYAGGGELDGRRTAALDKTREVVNGLEPRLATVSLCDVGKTRGRLKQGPYSNPGYFLRVRERSKELGPPLRYAPKNEMERVHGHLASLTLSDPGPWVGNKEFVFPTWRHPDPSQFAGSRLKLCSAPASNVTHDISGEKQCLPVNSNEPYVISSQSSIAIKDSMVPFRARRPEQELGKRWNNSSRDAKRTSRAPRPARSCHVSLRGLTHRGLAHSRSAASLPPGY